LGKYFKTITMKFDINLLLEGMYIFGKDYQSRWGLFLVDQVHKEKAVLKNVSTGVYIMYHDLSCVEAIYSKSIKEIVEDTSRDLVYEVYEVRYTDHPYLKIASGPTQPYPVTKDGKPRFISVLNKREPRIDIFTILGTAIPVTSTPYASHYSEGRFLWQDLYGYNFNTHFVERLDSTGQTVTWRRQFVDYTDADRLARIPPSKKYIVGIDPYYPSELPQPVGSDNSHILNPNNKNGTEHHNSGSALEVQGQTATIERGKAVTGSAAQFGTGSAAIEVGHLGYEACDSRQGAGDRKAKGDLPF
jgi:hypothetical protein